MLLRIYTSICFDCSIGSVSGFIPNMIHVSYTDWLAYFASQYLPYADNVEGGTGTLKLVPSLK